MNIEALKLMSSGKTAEEATQILSEKPKTFHDNVSEALKKQERADLYRDNEWFRNTVNALHEQYDAAVSTILGAALNTSLTQEDFAVLARVKAVEATKIRELLNNLTE